MQINSQNGPVCELNAFGFMFIIIITSSLTLCSCCSYFLTNSWRPGCPSSCRRSDRIWSGQVQKVKQTSQNHTCWHSAGAGHKRPRTSNVEAPFYTSWSCRAARLLEDCSSSPSAFSRSCRLFTSACHSALWLLTMMSICFISSCSSGSQEDRTELRTWKHTMSNADVSQRCSSASA